MLVLISLSLSLFLTTTTTTAAVRGGSDLFLFFILVGQKNLSGFEKMPDRVEASRGKGSDHRND